MHPYLEEKVEMLRDFGMNDRVAIIDYLESETKNDTSESKKEAHLDRLCHDMILAFFDGDRSFVKVKNKAKYYYHIIKRKYPSADAIYEDAIIEEVGYVGLNEMREAKLIETCAAFNGRKLYAI